MAHDLTEVLRPPLRHADGSTGAPPTSAQLRQDEEAREIVAGGETEAGFAFVPARHHGFAGGFALFHRRRDRWAATFTAPGGGIVLLGPYPSHEIAAAMLSRQLDARGPHEWAPLAHDPTKERGPQLAELGRTVAASLEGATRTAPPSDAPSGD